MNDTPEEHSERLAVLAQLEEWLEIPMQVLGFVWLGLLVFELTQGPSPLMAAISTGIWIIFILDFALRLTLAPDRSTYLRRNWLGVLSLLVPALRVLRIARAVRVLRATRAVRGIRLVRVVGTVNRNMRALGRSMGRRGFGYVAALTLVVVLAGAAGMYALEQEGPAGGFRDYGTALWWTAMVMTTMGSEYWPRTGEGRVLCLLLAIYAFTVFGYVTAALATYFIGRDAEDREGEIAGANAVEALRAEIAALTEQLRERPAS
ncbi:MAG: ion transporter [Gemmatimonadales bacterium]|nr:ion transporter [Gemmatimonadales bacterium]